VNSVNYEFRESFDIDDGSLSEFSPERAFVLGVEYEQVSRLLSNNEHFEKLVHSVNVDRMIKMAERRNEKLYTNWVNDDWVMISK
jgi:uncharacterized protein YdcH (DUF465 family)